MRTRAFLSLLIFICSGPICQAGEGVSFFQGDWAQVLEAAQQQGKLIFVDVYTSWCAPCKQMDKDVLPAKEVGDRYNDLFINYKIDAEKGEGVMLSGKYSVRAYPTYLYLDPQGYLLHRAEGYFEAPAFIAQAEKAVRLGSQDNPVSFLEKEFQSGNRQPAFLRQYIGKMSSLGLDNTAALDAYFAVMPVSDLSQKKELVFLGEQIRSVKFTGLPFFISHYSSLDKKEKKRLATGLYSRVFHNATGIAWKERRVLEMKQLIDYAHLLLPDIDERHYPGINKMKLLYYAMTRDLPGLKKTGEDIVSPLMLIPIDSIKAKDLREYQKIMQPFLSGEKDSTKVIGFEEEKEMIRNLYSAEITTKIYEVVQAFAGSLDARDPSLRRALEWIGRACEINPRNKAIRDLKDQVDAMVTIRASDGSVPD